MADKKKRIMQDPSLLQLISRCRGSAWCYFTIPPVVHHLPTPKRMIVCLSTGLPSWPSVSRQTRNRADNPLRHVHRAMYLAYCIALSNSGLPSVIFIDSAPPSQTFG